MFGLVHITSRVPLKTFTFPTKEQAEQACEDLNLNCHHVYYEAYAMHDRF